MNPTSLRDYPEMFSRCSAGLIHLPTMKKFDRVRRGRRPSSDLFLSAFVSQEIPRFDRLTATSKSLLNLSTDG
jgi:hypothetical protein